MKDTILVLSCLNGRVAAVAFHKGVAAGTWESSELVEDFGPFGEVVKKAVAETGYTGSQVMVVLGHPQLTVQLEEVPSTRGRALEAYLERRVNRSKNGEENLAWSHQPALQTKSAHAVILHIVPQTLVNQIVAGCEAAGLGLLRVLPAASVVARLLEKLDLTGEDVALLAAETVGATTVVVGDAQANVYLTRTMPQTWQTGIERMAMDVNRTALFAKQHCGATVGSIWLYGSVSEEDLALLQGRFTLPVKPCPLAYDPCGLARLAAEAPPRQDGNLIRPAQREVPARRRRRRVVVAAAAFLALVSVALAGYARFVYDERATPLRELQRKADALQAKLEEWQTRESTLLQQQEVIRAMQTPRAAPVPAWMLAYLAESLPSDLFLTNLQVYWRQDAWCVRMGGQPLITTNQAPPEILLKQIPPFTNRLAAGPFHLKPTRCDFGITNVVINETPPAQGILRRTAQAITDKVLLSRPTRRAYYFELEGTVH